jgi:hypothetical protein
VTGVFPPPPPPQLSAVGIDEAFSFEYVKVGFSGPSPATDALHNGVDALLIIFTEHYKITDVSVIKYVGYKYK